MLHYCKIFCWVTPFTNPLNRHQKFSWHESTRKRRKNSWNNFVSKISCANPIYAANIQLRFKFKNRCWSTEIWYDGIFYQWPFWIGKRILPFFGQQNVYCLPYNNVSDIFYSTQTLKIINFPRNIYFFGRKNDRVLQNLVWSWVEHSANLGLILMILLYSASNFIWKGKLFNKQFHFCFFSDAFCQFRILNFNEILCPPNFSYLEGKPFKFCFSDVRLANCTRN